LFRQLPHNTSRDTGWDPPTTHHHTREEQREETPSTKTIIFRRSVSIRHCRTRNAPSNERPVWRPPKSEKRQAAELRRKRKRLPAMLHSL
jgi:hypothetical protein